MSTPENTTVIVDYCRTAFAKASSRKKPGHFADVDPVDLMVPLINKMLDRTGLDPKHVKKLYTGVVHQEGVQGMNIARMNVLHPDSKLTQDTTGTSVDMFCASSMQALGIADAYVARNPDDVYIVTGVQSMSQIPMGGSTPKINSKVLEGNEAGFMNMGITAENLAEMYKISREEQDAFAVQSHKRAAKAQENGHFDYEIVEVDGLAKDDGIRADSNVETLGGIRTAFKAQDEGGTVTGGNSSQVTDGASAIMVSSEAFAQKNNLPIKARVLATAEVGLAPEIMGLGPVEASKQALEKAGLTMDDIDYIELNEAFSAQSLAVLKEWENQGMGVDQDKVNVDGGAIAMGHPLGASGARLVGHLTETLNRESKRYGLATLCIGGGQGMAVVIENPNAAPALKP